jgi:two-component system, chemotaxis family, CheB/CheR fusion protein
MPAAADSQSFEALLEHLRQTRGFDFTAYKRASLMRRVVKRMHTVDVPTFEAYLDYLQVHQEEFEALFNTILINVTSFFRDAEVWEHVAEHVLPALIEEHPAGSPIRIWSAGCASGQEPYSVAILLAERLGLDGLRERVKIYATDADNEALAEARQATYPARLMADVPAPLVEKYFESNGVNFTLNRDLRRVVIFGGIDLVQDAPISRVDFLLCRNTLMYFNAEAQTRILSRFAFSLNPNGFLLLGRAEMLFSHSTMFAPVDLKRRLFRVNVKADQRQRPGPPASAARDTRVNHVAEDNRLRDAAFDAEPIAQIVLDGAGALVAANTRARQQFGLSMRDIGRALRDLDVSYRPAELRGALDRAVAERREVALKDIQWFISGEARYYDITVSPLFDERRAIIGCRIGFEDVTRYRLLQTELHASKQQLDSAYEELQSTNEELETTNEELQSTVEELETTNEELQSTNEELETMNEELQSTNEELQTMNDEMRSRSTDVDTANVFLESVFTSLRSAVVVLDREYRVTIWNPGARELWGVSSDETIGANFLALDIGLPVERLRQPIRDVLSGTSPQSELTLAATSRRGKSIQCKVTLTPLHASGVVDTSGVIVVMQDSAEAV